jgi:uncharacterized protein (DUF433 family)
MNRAGMALHYHLYALGPLVILAELFEANGRDVYADRDGAIHRLAAFCASALQDPASVERLTGFKQVVSNPLSGTDIGWAIPYARRFPNPALQALLAKAAGTRSSQWGGEPPWWVEIRAKYNEPEALMEDLIWEDELDWRGCSAVQFDAEKMGGRATVGAVRMLADWVMDNYDDGMTAEEICEGYGLDLEPVLEIVAYATRVELKQTA